MRAPANHLERNASNPAAPAECDVASHSAPETPISLVCQDELARVRRGPKINSGNRSIPTTSFRMPIYIYQLRSCSVNPITGLTKARFCAYFPHPIEGFRWAPMSISSEPDAGSHDSIRLLR
jgi:hypothetical protein